MTSTRKKTKKIKWPKKVKILGYEYEINYSILEQTNKFDTGLGLKGMIPKYGEVIYIDNTLPPLAKLETLIHEIAEGAILHTDGGMKNHDQFSRMLVLLVPILVDIGVLIIPED